MGESFKQALLSVILGIALQLYGSMRLGARIFDLRERGMPIDTRIRVDDLVLGVEKPGTSRYAIYSRRDGRQLTNVFF